MAENSRNDFMSRISGNGRNTRQAAYSQANKSSMQKRASSSAGEARNARCTAAHAPREAASPRRNRRARARAKACRADAGGNG